MARNVSTKISDLARSQYESRIIMNCKNNPKTFWSYVEKLINQEMYPHWRIITVNLLLGLQTTQPTSGGAVTVVSSCCANCVEPPRPQ